MGRNKKKNGKQHPLIEKKDPLKNSQKTTTTEDHLSKKNFWITIIGVIVTIIALIITLYVTGLIPFPNVDVKIYNWLVSPIYNIDNTTIVKLNTIFPSHITNTGNVPVHIVVFTVYLSENGKPVGLQNETISEISYLRPQESFTYNLTKSFDVNIPVIKGQVFPNYLIVVGYYTSNLNNIEYHWFVPTEIK